MQFMYIVLHTVCSAPAFVLRTRTTIGRGASPSMDRRRGIDFLRHSAHWSWRCLCFDADWTHLFQHWLLEQRGELIVRCCCDCFSNFDAVYKSTDFTQKFSTVYCYYSPFYSSALLQWLPTAVCVCAY